MSEKLKVEIGADVTGLQKGLAQAANSVDKFARKAEAVGKKMASTGRTMTKSLTLPITILGGFAVSTAIKFEKLSVSLNVLAGSAKEGAKQFKKLKEFSAATPFQLDELVKVNNTLLGFGLSTDKAFTSLKRLADISAVTGANLGNVAVAFGQSAAAGRVMTQDLNQFINNGIPIYKLLGDVTGKNVGELRDLASQGGITFDLLEQGFKKATEEGGMFFEGTLKLSKTLGGQLSTLMDNISLLGAGFGQVIGEKIAPLIKKITALAARFDKLSPSMKRTVVNIALIVAALGPLITIIGVFITTALPGLVSALVFLYTTVLPAVTGAFAALNAVMLANPIIAVAVVIVGLTSAFVEYITTITTAVSRTRTWVNLLLSGGDGIRFIQLQMESQVKGMREYTEVSGWVSNRTERMTAMFAKWNAELKETTPNIIKVATELKKIAPPILPGKQVSASAIDKKEEDSPELVPKRLDAITQSLTEFGMNTANIIQGSIAGTFQELGAVIGEALASGDNVLKAVGGALLNSLGNFLSDMGGMLIEYGTLAVLKGKLDLAILAGGPVSIAAGLAAIGVGILLSAAGGALGNRANAGVNGSVGGSGSGGFKGSSTQVSNTQSGFQNIRFELEGTTLIGVINNSMRQDVNMGGSIGLLNT